MQNFEFEPPPQKPEGSKTKFALFFFLGILITGGIFGLIFSFFLQKSPLTTVKPPIKPGSLENQNSSLRSEGPENLKKGPDLKAILQSKMDKLQGLEWVLHFNEIKETSLSVFPFRGGEKALVSLKNLENELSSKGSQGLEFSLDSPLHLFQFQEAQWEVLTAKMNLQLNQAGGYIPTSPSHWGLLKGYFGEEWHKLHREIPGTEKRVDLEKGKKLFLDTLKEIQWETRRIEINLPLQPKPISHQFKTLREEEGFSHLLSIYQTQFDPENTPRCENLKISLEKMDGVVVGPGKLFSFNSIVGPRTSKAGFKDAGVILRGKVVPGIGGGICQVTSTLYNAILKLDFPVKERYNHSIYTSATSYVPIGFDAAVVWGAKDFRFLNNLPEEVLISALMEKDSMIISLWGKSPFPKKVELFQGEKKIQKQKTIVKNKKSPDLKRGEEKVLEAGVDGYIVTNLMRVTLPDGKVINKVITTDRYLTYNSVVHKGI